MSSQHVIAIFGGAVAGSEAAAQLSAKGKRVVVFDQNALPYGKIESGLPKWHYKLRDRQEGLINQKLNNPLVHFVPNIKLGRDIGFEEVYNEWGFSAILLATGAWADRPLPIEGIDDYINKGFYYQNPFVQWFNLNHDPNYNGPQFEIPDGTIIIGGGLASIDMAKIVMIETTRLALQKRDIIVNTLELEHKGIPKVLEEYGLTFPDLGLKGCTLFTRRGVGGMALSPMPENPTPGELEQAIKTREKLMNKVREKFLFNLQTFRVSIDKIVKNGRLTGLVFEETKDENGRLVSVPGSAKEYHAPLVISSIGSVPEKIPGLPYEGDIFKVDDRKQGKITGFENVFALGNAVTGRGNIRESVIHSRQVSETIVDQFLAVNEQDYNALFEAAEKRALIRVNAVMQTLESCELKPEAKVKEILKRVEELQNRVGYDGDYDKWIKKHLPVRLEDMVNE